MALWGAFFIFGWQYTSRLGSIARGIFIGVALFGPIGWIGLFEGGYNHALKIILFQFDLPAATVQRYYPPGIYEPPQDLFFETTGVMQLAVALWGLGNLLKFVRISRGEETK